MIGTITEYRIINLGHGGWEGSTWGSRDGYVRDIPVLMTEEEAKEAVTAFQHTIWKDYAPRIVGVSLVQIYHAAVIELALKLHALLKGYLKEGG